MTRPEFQVHTYAAGVRRTKRATVPHTTTVTVRVDQRVWQAALDLAGGDVSRLTVVSPTEVTVHNRPDRTRRVNQYNLGEDSTMSKRRSRFTTTTPTLEELRGILLSPDPGPECGFSLGRGNTCKGTLDRPHTHATKCPASSCKGGE